MPEDYEQADLQVGETYYVVLEDCCIQGSFTAKYLGWDEAENEGLWDNGVRLGPDWGQWKAYKP